MEKFTSILMTNKKTVEWPKQWDIDILYSKDVEDVERKPSLHSDVQEQKTGERSE